MKNLNQTWRPRKVADLVSQPAARSVLGSYLKAPYAGAFLFHGPTGTGKTSAAHVLAAGLGVSVDDAELGGWIQIPSGELKADSVRKNLDMLRYRPLMGSGWRVLVCNEADRLNQAAEYLFLDALEPENLPEKALVIFTANSLKFSPRFLGRCHQVDFEFGPQAYFDLEKHVQRVWTAETGKTSKAPPLKQLGVVEDGAVDFRSALSRLQPFVNRAKEMAGLWRAAS